MESVAVRPQTAWRGALRHVDGGVISIWALAGGLVLYLGIDGGGYDLLVHSQVGVVVWWIVLIAAAWGLLPAARLTRAAWVGLGLFGAFIVWTAVATTWSLSTERSLEDLALVVGYLGVLVLGVLAQTDRERGLRNTVAALATAIVVIAGLALVSRLRPGLIPSAAQTSSLIHDARNRLSWPINYWNGLAALLAFGIPLLLALATSARRLGAQAAAAGALPAVVLCGYLTLSRGGALAAAVAVVVFIALTPERLNKLATLLTVGAGSAVLIAGAVHRNAIENGLGGAAARHQGGTLFVSIILVCGGVALAQVGLSLAARHGIPPRAIVLMQRRARLLVAAGAAAAVVIALAAGVPSKLQHAWRDFKHPTTPALNTYSISRFEAVSGNGRYDLWKVAVNMSSQHPLKGWGPGTYQLLWLPRATPVPGYVENAHSLYLETLAELGIVGLALLAGFFVMVISCAVALVRRVRDEDRTRAAAATAALLAFMVSAAFDWIWQIPVLPVAFMVLAAAVLAPSLRSGRQPMSARARVLGRAGAVLAALACLAAIAVPLATTSAVRASQAAARSGNLPVATRDAEQAARIEPGAASVQIQLALVEELHGNLPAALAAARHATHDEPANWTTWLVRSRLEADTGHPSASLAAFRRARALNPLSPLFAHA